jgi:hypothetical protein
MQAIPRGPRKRRGNGAPESAYLRDTLSNTYRRERSAAGCEADANTAGAGLDAGARARATDPA